MLGFVIVRHVVNNMTDEYWKESYNCIRKFYPAETYPILIVDDDSDKRYLKSDIELHNCQVVESEYKRVGELLGYYYFHKLRFAEKAVIIHDSVFFNSFIDFSKYEGVHTLWSFAHDWDENSDTLKLISYLDNNEEMIQRFNQKDTWLGCFGCISVIDWELLDKINSRYNLFTNLIPHIKNRPDRCCMERVLACAFANFTSNPCVLMDIHKYGWWLTYHDYKLGKLAHLPVIKVWTGR